MKINKKVSDFILSICIAVCLPITVSSEEYNDLPAPMIILTEDGDYQTVQSEGIIHINIEDSKERISKDGTFSFKFSESIMSDNFTLSSTTTTITLTPFCMETARQTFSITLYEYWFDPNRGNWVYTGIESKKATANGKEQSYSFNNLETNKIYCFRLSKNDFLNDNVVQGSGQISNIAEIK